MSQKECTKQFKVGTVRLSYDVRRVKIPAGVRTIFMTIPFWCLFVVSLMPILAAGVGAKARLALPGGMDNENPRQQALLLEGVGSRAYAAQANAWEALAVFTVAVMINHLAKGALFPSGILALIFIVARFGHLLAYLSNKGNLRSLCYGVGLLCCVGLVILGALAP